MRMSATIMALAVLFSPAAAHSDSSVFRPVSFICLEGATGTAVKIEENIQGQRKRFAISYHGGKPTLFQILASRNGRNYKPVASIDLRTENDVEKIEAAHYLAGVMDADSKRFCHGSARDVLAARFELGANHRFNRSHPLYRGK